METPKQKTILVLVSNPEGTTPLNLPSELRRLKEAVRRSQQRNHFKVELEFAANQTELRRHLLDIKPQIVHFCGHGTQQGLMLDDENGRTTVVSNEVLVDLLRTFADRIECVLLNACNTEPLATSLAKHLNYAIGMISVVQDDAAIVFAEAFYDALGGDQSYENAFDLGKNAILGNTSSGGAQSLSEESSTRRLVPENEDGEPLNAQNQEHLIPVLKVNLHPKEIQLLWLSEEEERQAVRELLEAIESGFNTVKLFHTDEPIVLKDQYIPVQVTLDRRYNHTVETISGYAESEAELKRIYALKGLSEEEIKRQQVDWQEARQQESRIVVLADPGMGKSTLLRMEVVTTVQRAYQELDEVKPVGEIMLPLLIRLSTLAEEVENMPAEDAVCKIIQERHSRLLKHHENTRRTAFLNEFLNQQLLNGKALLLLDALDEVPSGDRKKLLEKLKQFAENYPCPIVATSRIVGYGGKLVDGAKDMEIVPFTQKQTEQYIETWFKNAPIQNQSVSAQGLIKALRDRPQIAGLAQNPLLLSLICSLYQQEQLTLPVRRCELYAQAVNYMLGRWETDNERGETDEAWVLAKKNLLEELAYRFSCEGQQIFTFGELRREIEKFLKSENVDSDLEGAKTADLIKELCEDDGILQRLSAEDDKKLIEKRRYLFLHRTFQEYLTAAYLCRVDGGHISFEKLFWDYDWHETICLLAGLMDEPLTLIQKIVNTKDDIFQTQLLLAGRCIAECGEIVDTRVEQIIDLIYQFWESYLNVEFVRSVVVAIGQVLPNDRALEALVQALAGPDDDLKRNAAFALGEIGNDRAEEALIQALADPNYRVRGEAVTGLWDIGNDRAVDALIQALADPEVYVRSRAADVLGDTGNDRAVEALIQALADSDNWVRKYAAEALGKIGNDRAVEALIQALADPDNWVSSYAAYALGKIGNDRVVEALIQALADPDNWVRSSAAFALGKIGNDRAVEVLTQALADPDDDLKRNAADALGKIGNDRAVEALTQALADLDDDLKRNAADALGEIGAVEVLIQKLVDPDAKVRSSAAYALGKIGNDSALEALIQALADPDAKVRSSAAYALGKIGNDRAVEALIQALADPYDDLRSSAAEALGKIGNDRAVEALIQALADPGLYVRSSAAYALGKIGNDRAVEALIQALADPDDYVRSSAAHALGKINSLTCLEKLLQSVASNLIYQADIFVLARSWAIRFSKSGTPFIPVYPEYISAPSTTDDVEKS